MKDYDVLSPTCYQEFACKGGECRTTCCYGWKIAISRDEYKRIGKNAGIVKNQIVPTGQIARGGEKEYKIVLNQEEFCPFLDEEKWCGLQRKFGVDILPAICREFPRIYHQYQHMEGALSLGCEGVLELLLKEKEHLQFSRYTKTISGELSYKTSKVNEKMFAKYPILRYYDTVKDLCVSLLQAEGASLENRMLLLGIALHRIDVLVKEKKTEQIPIYIEHYFEQLEEMDVEKQLESISAENVEVLYNNLMIASVTISNTKYREYIDRIKEKMQMEVIKERVLIGKPEDTISLTCSAEAYVQAKAHFAEFIKGKEYFLENLMVGLLWQMNTPFKHLDQGVWKDYMYFVWTYSMLKTVLTLTLDENSTIEEMIDCCVIMFRQLGHSEKIKQSVLKDFEKNHTDSVAHMAVFLKA